MQKMFELTTQYRIWVIIGQTLQKECTFIKRLCVALVLCISFFLSARFEPVFFFLLFLNVFVAP